MGAESQVQTKIIKYLKLKGCYVIKTHASPGTPVGCPDVFFFKEGFYGALECKASKTSRFQPLQKETIEQFARWSYGRVIYPANYEEIKSELEKLL